MQEETGYFAGYYLGNPDFELEDIVYDTYIMDPNNLDSYKINQLVLVNLDVLDEYLETFRITEESFINKYDEV